MNRSFVIFSLCLLAACNRSSSPAPVVQHDLTAGASMPTGKVKAVMPKQRHPSKKLHHLTDAAGPLANEKNQTLHDAKRASISLKKEKIQFEKGQDQKKATEMLPKKAENAPSDSQQKPAAVEKVSVKTKSEAKHYPAFAMPVQGKIISTFGYKKSGLQNDGINIAAPVGASVQAAEEGTVVFANEKKGFGQLILVKHKGGWVSAYAHLGRMLVKPGQHISKGQGIAEIGQSGDVDQPQLHFEIRKDTKPLNPADYVKPK